MQNYPLKTLISIGVSIATIAVTTVPGSLLAQSSSPTSANYKIAFIGDQGLGSNSRAVLNLIKSEGAAAVVHVGDFDYIERPDLWETQIDDILGDTFPYFSAVGNHDLPVFYGAGGYQEYMEARMNRIGISWDGDLGVKSSFTYNGIFFVLTAPGVTGSNHSTYIRDRLAQDSSIWSISGWHKNQKKMQVGGKTDETGWSVYDESRKGGAIIATGHEHSYSRTHLLSNCQNQTVASTSNTLVLKKDDSGTGGVDEGRSFAFVSGLAGLSLRDQELSGSWWASIYTTTQGSNYGALFGTFNVDGDPRKAKFYFKDIDGDIPDSFVVRSEVEPLPVAIDPDDAVVPDRTSLSQNYPNPFNPQTEIRFQLSTPEKVELIIINILGQNVRTLVETTLQAGSHTVRWDGKNASMKDVPSGVYFYRLRAGRHVQIRKMMLLR